MSYSEQPPAIEANDLRKRYPGNVQALDGVTFSVTEGAIYGLLGPNGAGKSTTVRILTTLSRADGGTALSGAIRQARARVKPSSACVMVRLARNFG